MESRAVAQTARLCFILFWYKILYIWMVIDVGKGNTLDPVPRMRLLNFPMRAGGRRIQLGKIQAGLEPDDWKSLDNLGSGVRELRIRERAGSLMMYVAKFDEALYVLHAFQRRRTRRVTGTATSSARDIVR